MQLDLANLLHPVVLPFQSLHRTGATMLLFCWMLRMSGFRLLTRCMSFNPAFDVIELSVFPRLVYVKGEYTI